MKNRSFKFPIICLLISTLLLFVGFEILLAQFKKPDIPKPPPPKVKTIPSALLPEKNAVVGHSSAENSIFEIAVLGWGDTDSGVAVYGNHVNTGNIGQLGTVSAAVYGLHGASQNIGELGTEGAAVYGINGASQNIGELGIEIAGVFGESGSNAAIFGLTRGELGTPGAFQLINPSNSRPALDVQTSGVGYAGHFFISNAENSSPALYVETEGKGPAAQLKGNLQIKSRTTDAIVLELGEGLDYAEGFDVATGEHIDPGTVLVIDAENPGKLAMSDSPYDTRVAGIVTGGKKLGSGVCLGVGRYQYHVALAGRVYCNVVAYSTEISPGDLLTTSSIPGYAMAVKDFNKAQGAILGKAMEKMPLGKKGQILVLVSLQ
jgi:hypothetical protein